MIVIVKYVINPQYGPSVEYTCCDLKDLLLPANVKIGISHLFGTFFILSYWYLIQTQAGRQDFIMWL